MNLKQGYDNQFSPAPAPAPAPANPLEGGVEKFAPLAPLPSFFVEQNVTMAKRGDAITFWDFRGVTVWLTAYHDDSGYNRMAAISYCGVSLEDAMTSAIKRAREISDYWQIYCYINDDKQSVLAQSKNMRFV